MMIIWVVVVALAAPLMADPMNDYKDSGPQRSFQRFDERRPGAFETFTPNYLRRVDAEFAAGGDFACVRFAGGRVQCTRRLSMWVNPLFYFCSSMLVRRARVAQPVAKAEMNWFVPCGKPLSKYS